MSAIRGLPNFQPESETASSTAQVASVQLGETNLSQVAQRLGIGSDDLAAANPQIADPAKLSAGQDIRLPQPLPASVSGAAGSPAPSGLTGPPAPLGDPMAKNFIQGSLDSQAPQPGASSPGEVRWGDIKGGSTDDKHKDWSEITGFSHGMK